MKPVFLLGSVINVSEGTFNYMDHSRSSQSAMERAKQTLLSLNSIFCRVPNAKIYIIEGSLNLPETLLISSGISHYLDVYDVELVKLVDVDEDACVELNTHRNKSYCESLLYSTFLRHYKEDLKNYDMIIKMSGRYSLTVTCDIGQMPDKNKVYFKRELYFPNPNNEQWAYPDLLIPGQELTDAKWTTSILFAFGVNRLNDLQDFFNFIISNTKNRDTCVEQLIQYWSWMNKINHEEIGWMLCGWNGGDDVFWYQ